MRLASYAIDGSQRWGFVRGDGALVDAGLAYDAVFESEAPHSVLELIDGGDGALEKAREVAGKLADMPEIDAGKIQWQPPVRRPGKILGVALNNPALLALAEEPFTQPAMFVKASSALLGHGQAIEMHKSYGLTHPEPELAIIIGERAKNISETEAHSIIFGYTVVNDITSHGLKNADSIALNKGDGALTHSSYLARSKSCDTFAPMGPWLVSADEVKDPDALAVKAWINDQQFADDVTGDLVFNTARVIAHASRHFTLLPGDIIMMGTAAKPVDISLGQADMTQLEGPVRIEIEGIGTLENPINLTD